MVLVAAIILNFRNEDIHSNPSQDKTVDVSYGTAWLVIYDAKFRGTVSAFDLLR